MRVSGTSRHFHGVNSRIDQRLRLLLGDAAVSAPVEDEGIYRVGRVLPGYVARFLRRRWTFCQLLEEHPVDLKDRRIYFCGLTEVVGSSKFVRLL